MRRKQEPPFCIQVELTEGCNLYCDFCGLQGIRTQKDKNYKPMTMETAEQTARLIAEADGWNPRIEFAMHGEPTANKRWLEIITLFREWLPKHNLMMLSNGLGFMKDPDTTITAAIKILNCLGIDAYEYAGIYPIIRDKYSKRIPWYPKDGPWFNPHARTREHFVTFVQDISEATEGTHSVLNNHCGCGSAPNDKADGKRCAKPFREMAVRWDGNVAMCCNDWRGIMKVENVNNVDSIETIWQHEVFHAARLHLYHGLRTVGPCKGCDAISYRPGLLPDKKGQESLPQPSPTWRRRLQRACDGESYTEHVKRPWELTVEGQPLC